MRRCLADTGDRAVPAVKHSDVLRHGELVCGPVERTQVAVVGAAIDVAQLLARELEVRAQLDQRQHPPLKPEDPVARRRGQRARAPEIRR